MERRDRRGISCPEEERGIQNVKSRKVVKMKRRAAAASDNGGVRVCHVRAVLLLVYELKKGRVTKRHEKWFDA